MIKQHTNGQKFFTAILSVCLGLAFHATAQQRGGGGGGGGFGGGGFGGGGFGGGGRSGTSTGAGSTSRQYPNNTTIGDAYFSVDPETRRVVYIADEATALAIGQVLTNLDRPKPQVLIKCVFLEVTRDDSLDIGLEGYYSKNLGNSWNNGGMVTNYAVVSNNIVPTSITGGKGSQMFNGSNIFGLPSPGSFSGGNGIYQILGQDFMVTLHAIAQAGKSKILARPSILARNNQPATITIGSQVPLITGTTYDSLGNQHNALTWQNIGVILQVTPFITKDGMVEMIVAPSISRLNQTVTIPISTTISGSTVSTPTIDIRSANTVVNTADGLPVIIGGLTQNVKTETITKIPLLGDIPLLGNFFQRKQKDDTKSELIIILTPHVVQATTELAALTAKERDRSAAIRGLSEEELNKFLDELPKKKTAPDASSKPGKSAPVLPPKGS